MRRLALMGLVVWLAPAAAARADAPLWRLEQPAPPAGAPFAVPLGTPGDLTFYAPNRGLLAVEGNSVVPRGILAWNGQSWHQLSTVCGGPGDTMRIAWAGPDEFWTVSEPSRPRQGDGTALCHFVNGQVAGSYSTADNAADPYRQMDAAACNGPDDCWFGGIGSRDPTGNRVGAFHLHWDGNALRTVYDTGSGQGVTDVEPHNGSFIEAHVLGPQRDDHAAPDPATTSVLGRISGTTFIADPFAAPGDELLALDGDWAAGGGAASGPQAPTGSVVPNGPLLARIGPDDGFHPVALTGATFAPTERFVDVAAVPGTATAWAASVPYADRETTNVKARVAFVDASTGTASVESVPASGSGRGAAARIAFTSPTDGWMVTNAGWVFHYTDGTPQPLDTDPAFNGPIDFRPNEAAEQFVPDSAPADDSQLFAPPPVDVQTTAGDTPAPPKRLSALISHVSKPKLVHGTTLVLKFRVARKAKIQLVAKRKGKAVARTKSRTFNKGNHSLSLKLSKKRWPTALQWKTKELTIDPDQISSGDDTTTTTTTTTTTG